MLPIARAAGLLALLVLAAGVAGSAEQQPLFSATPPPGQRCAAEVPVPADWNLTASERELLQYICWPLEGAPSPEQLAAAPPVRSGVPPGVNCTVVQW